jgi:rhodanese-related sulfurtransferase
MNRYLLWISNFYFLVLAACGQEYKSYSALLKHLYQNSVPVIMPAQLHHEWQNDSSLVILDTRAKKEYTVSHLPGAQFAGYDDFSLATWAKLPKTAKIVVYCSVGYRSERVGEQLLKAGYTNVHNLYGGIFQWKNEGFAVQDTTNVTERVHAYSPKWGKWLEKGEKVYE